jgi:hypothetical protein
MDGVYPGMKFPEGDITFIGCLAKSADSATWLAIRSGIFKTLSEMSKGEKFSVIFSEQVEPGTVVDNSDGKYINQSREGVPDEVIFK